MFSAIEKDCKTQYGYGAWPDVRQTGRRPDDRMESFWLGETLKYPTYMYIVHMCTYIRIIHVTPSQYVTTMDLLDLKLKS